MAGNQQARIVDTIVELKRAFLRRSDDSDGEDPIAAPTNRGNKLMLHAKYVQEGHLISGSGSAEYRKKIEHAGYERDIIYRNPRRYDEDGDLIVIDEPDDEADLSPAEDNIYGEIHLEDTLAPLIAASDLANHPSLSVPYTNRYIDQMIEQISQTLHREQQNLVKMKNLLTTLRGDADFVPSGAMQTDYDDLLARGQGFAIVSQAQLSAQISVADMQSRADASEQPGLLGRAEDTQMADQGTLANGTTSEPSGAGRLQSTSNAEDVAMATNGGVHDTQRSTTLSANGQATEANEETNSAAGGEGDDEDMDLQPTSHRMTTRAQANKNSGDGSLDDLSAKLEDEVLPVHPYFMFPSTAAPDPDFGLPRKEAEDARNFLTHYVAKQEEVVRSIIELHEGLLKAKRLRDTVMKWSKAEAHVGEMSDGEDWYDMEEWGLEAPLKKGVEEIDEEGIGQKKTRRQRAGNN